MNKQEFLLALRSRLQGLPESDLNQWCEYYSEMIDDRIEDGLSEQQAIDALGGVETVASQILKETPMPQLVKSRLKPKISLTAWHIVLIILGAPLWLPLIAAIVFVIFAAFAAICSGMISLYAAAVAVIGTALGSLVCMGVYFYMGNTIGAIAFLSAALVLMGLGILGIIICNTVLKYAIILSKKLWLYIKECFVKKEAVR